MQPFAGQPTRVKVILLIYCVCLAGAASSHLLTILQFGFLSGRDTSLAWSIFSDLLAVLDPLIIFLLYFSPRRGLLLLAGVMVADIAFNAYWYHQTGVLDFRNGSLFTWILAGQVAFGLFVFVTAPIVWKHAAKQR
jgi:hypothetical protein